MIGLGCSKNQVDAERMLFSLRQAGFVISPVVSDCDVVIVNTCGFIEDAKRESIEAILELATEKKRGKKLKGIVVTGCLSERYRDEFVRELPEVDGVLGIGKNGDIAAAVRDVLAGGRHVDFGEKETLPLEGGRVLTTPSYTAYLKIAEGCDNRCSYCAIPDIRGHFRSREMENILREAETLAEQGVRELCVVAQDTTRYGEDIYRKLMLPELLERLCGISGLSWIRILYCYPDRVTDELLAVMRDQPKIVKYMDIPVQHASGRILSSMNRRGSRQSLTALMTRIRETVPGIALRTTLIAGFPGETEEDFVELCAFARDVRFDRLGCFAYSLEEGTPAAEIPGQVDEETKRRRVEVIMEQQAGIAEQLALEAVGRGIEVLCEGYDKSSKLWVARSFADAPDIDTKVYFRADEKPRPGDFVRVLITEASGYDLVGDMLPSGKGSLS